MPDFNGSKRAINRMEEAATRHAKAEDALERQLRVLNEAPPHYSEITSPPTKMLIPETWSGIEMVPITVTTFTGISRVAAWVRPEDIDIIKFKERE